METLLAKQHDQSVLPDSITETRRVLTPRANVIENAKVYTVQVELPGVVREELEITFAKNVLNIQGKPTLTRDKGYKQVYREYLEGAYQRRFVLSDGIDPNGIEARLDNGVLEISLAKIGEEIPRQIPLSVA
jgi:HSP20 family protein